MTFPRGRWMVRYEGPERPCDLCAPNGSHKRALFRDRRRGHLLCAKCMVSRIEKARYGG